MSRLVVLALQALCERQNQSIMASYTIFETKTLKWYKGASQRFEKYSLNELVYIIFVCACGYRLFLDATIPNTNLVIGDFIDQGIIFHYGDYRYSTLLLIFSKARRQEILEHSKSLIDGVDVSKCFLLFDSWLNNIRNWY